MDTDVRRDSHTPVRREAASVPAPRSGAEPVEPVRSTYWDLYRCAWVDRTTEALVHPH